jgi:hypothetical protein
MRIVLPVSATAPIQPATAIYNQKVDPFLW